MKRCELCSHLAQIYCQSDNASLCYDCDQTVHSANILVVKHSRTLLCYKCQSPTPWTASGLNLGRAASVCVNCHSSQRPNDIVEENHEETDGDDDDSESSDESDYYDDDDDDDDDEDAENQVVPWSSVVSPPVSGSSSSSSSEEFCCRRFSSDGFRSQVNRDQSDHDIDYEHEDYRSYGLRASSMDCSPEPPCKLQAKREDRSMSLNEGNIHINRFLV